MLERFVPPFKRQISTVWFCESLRSCESTWDCNYINFVSNIGICILVLKPTLPLTFRDWISCWTSDIVWQKMLYVPHSCIKAGHFVPNSIICEKSLKVHCHIWDNFWQFKAHQKRWKIIFISPQKLFLFSRFLSWLFGHVAKQLD